MAEWTKNEKILSFIDNDSIKEYMKEYSPITTRYIRSNLNVKPSYRNLNDLSLSTDPQNTLLRGTHQGNIYSSQPISPETRGSLMNFKQIIKVEDVD